MHAELPYDSLATIGEKRTVRAMRSASDRKRRIRPGDRIVYDPFNKEGVAQSWRDRAGLPATVVRAEMWEKCIVTFDHEPGRELRPAWTNFYLSDGLLTNMAWEV